MSIKLAATLLAAILLAQVGGCRADGRSNPAQAISTDDTQLCERLSKEKLERWLDTLDPLPNFPPDQQRWDDPPRDRNVAIMGIPQPGDIANDGPRYFLFHPAGAGIFWLGKSKGLSGGTDWFGPAFFTNDDRLLISVGQPHRCR